MGRLFFAVLVGILLIGIGLPIAIAVFGGKQPLDNLSDWQSGLGALEGALLGLLAVVFGALYHASESRKRDLAQHEREVKAVAAAFAAEIEVIGYSIDVLRNQVDLLASGEPLDGEDIWRPSLTIFHNNTHRIGLLGPELASRVTHLASISEELSRGVAGRKQMLFQDKNFAARAASHIQLVADQAKETAEYLRQAAGDTKALPLPDNKDSANLAEA